MKKLLLVIFLLLFTINEYAQYGPSPAFFRMQRAAPLVDLNTTQTILVSNYGATVNDGIDDRTSIQNAIQAAVSAGTLANPVRLVFESGRYDIMPPDGITHGLQMTDANYVLWDGQNAEFVNHNPAVGFLNLLRCNNTVIKDFSVDYATLPFTQGVITKVDVANAFFEFRVDDGFPLPTATHFGAANERWGMIKNSSGGIKKGTKNLIPHNNFFESIGTRTYRYANQSGNLSGVEVGDYFVHMARNNARTIIVNNAGKNLTYLNITAFSSPAGGFNAFNSDSWHVLDCKIKFKDNRKHTLNADAMHINGGKIGPWVENSLFEGFADDCVNIKYTKREIRTIHSSTQITVVNSVTVGETMEFYNPRGGILLGNATVTAVQNLGSNLFTITLSNSINLTTVSNPDHQLTDKAYIESRSNESFIFRNNIVRNNRRHGLLIQSKYALIENNLFQNQSTSGIALENGVDWGEGFRADNIEIKNNTFENCGVDTEYISDSRSAAIIVDFMKLGTPCNTSTTWCGTQSTDVIAHSNIRILDNRINYNKRGVYLKNINGLVFTNNFICHNNGDISLVQNETPTNQTLLNNSGVTLEDYNFVVPNANLQFKLSESNANSALLNTGTNQTVDLEKLLTGGEITQGFIDNEVGFVLNINTAGNGQLRLINKADDSPFPGPTADAARSYSFWIKPEEAIFQTLIYSGGPTAGEVFAVQMQANRVLRVTDNNQNFISMTDMPLDIGVWNHITITMPVNGTMSNISLYKNGVASNETLSGSDVSINTASSNLDFFPRFKGLASDIRFFDYDLPSCEVESVYNDRQINNPNSIEPFVSATGNDTTGNGSSEFPYATINKAVLEATDGATIKIVGTILQTGEVTIAKNITFQGQSNAVIIGDGINRLFNITLTAAVSFSNITFQNFSGNSQGVVINTISNDVNLTFTDCLFQNNTGSHQNGTVIYVGNADATFTRCTFNNNTATATNGRGAAIIFGGSFSGVINNSTFYKNKLTENTSNTIGAAVVSFTTTDPTTQQLTITNSLFVDNTNKNGNKVDIQYPSQNLSVVNTLAENTIIGATNNTSTNSNLTANFTNSTFTFLSSNVTFSAPNALTDATPIDFGNDGNDVGSWDSKITLFTNNSSDFNWETPTNWSGSAVPTSTDNVAILADSGNVVISSTTQAVSNDLFVNSPSSLTINPGGSLIVNGISTGNVTYKRILTAFAGNTNGWHLVASPLASETFDVSWALSNEIATGSNANLGIATYNTAGIPTRWAYLQSPNGSIASNSGIGYSMKRTTTGTVSFTGTINTDNVNGVSISTAENGFNLLGNPYTAFMSSETFLADNPNLNQDQIWTWTHSNGYRARIKAADFILAPGQGFFVKATTGNTVNFAESNQSSGIDNFQKSSTSEINLFIGDNEISRVAQLLYFDNNVTEGYDAGYEGQLFDGIAHSFAIYSELVANHDGKKYQVQSLPKQNMESIVIPIGIIAAAGKEITFTAEALHLPENIKVFLEDRLTNTITRLDEVNSSYKVILSESLDGTGRFYLQTKTSGVLSTNDIVLQNINVFATNINTLKISGLPYGNTKVKLLNVFGKQLMQKSFTSTGIKEITIPKLATGMYIVQLETVSGNLNKKIVLE